MVIMLMCHGHSRLCRLRCVVQSAANLQQILSQVVTASPFIEECTVPIGLFYGPAIANVRLARRREYGHCGHLGQIQGSTPEWFAPGGCIDGHRTTEGACMGKQFFSYRPPDPGSAE